MRKCFCDACNKEITRPVVLSVPCHLYSKRKELGYIDNEGNRVSGRTDDIELCNHCSNKAFSAALKEINL